MIEINENINHLQAKQKQLVKTRLILILPAIILFYAKGICQEINVATLKTDFSVYNSQNLHEKIFLHTDKTFYVAGEIVWFKLYDVDGVSNKPVDLSKVAYIEILNREQKPVLQAKVALHDGDGNGSFFLPLSFNSGVYKIRAYTNWMKNSSADFYFEKNLTIVNPLKKLGPITAVSAPAYDIQFFPEGGNLVTGIQSKVAFRIVDQSGNGIACKGSVVDQNNKVVTGFQTYKFGMGNFLFTPHAGDVYKAVINTTSNNAITANFPATYGHGYTLQVTDPDKGHVKITAHRNGEPGEAIYLFAHAGRKVEAAELLTLNNDSAVYTIDKNSLGDGISHFTLFNANRQPVCERLYFKRPEHQLAVKAKTEFDEYKSRKKIYVDILTQDEKNAPATADMSISVFMADSLQLTDDADITSYLWLSSELKGHIESAGYYFNTNHTDADLALDNLMLTQGWRRFKWDEVGSHTPPSFEFAPEYEGHIVSGRLTDKRSGMPAENITTYLTVPGEHYELESTLSNAKGKVQFDMKKFYASSEIIVETGNKKEDSVYRVDILNPFSEKFSETPVPVFDFPERLQDQLVSHSLYAQVQNTFLTDSLQQFYAPAELKDSTAFYGQPDKKYFLDDYTRFGTMEEVMREYVAKILVKKQQGKFHIQVMDDSWHNFFDDDPLVLLDGVPVSDVDRIIAFDPFKVKKIELVNRQYFLGSAIADGIVSYSTYKGDLGGFQLDPNAVILEYEGLQLQREFFAPVYDTPAQAGSRMPDFRNVLYWSPTVKTDEHGKKQLSFFSSDQKGKYIVFVQGITADGRSGSQVAAFEVTK